MKRILTRHVRVVFFSAWAGEVCVPCWSESWRASPRSTEAVSVVGALWKILIIIYLGGIYQLSMSPAKNTKNVKCMYITFRYLRILQGLQGYLFANFLLRG